MSTDKITMIKGPATVMLQGSCHVLGSNVSDRIISIRAGKALPFQLTGNCKLHVKLGQDSRIWRADPATAGIAIWYDVVRQIFSYTKDQQKRAIIVMLVGNKDTGKSTFSTYLANTALSNGIKPCIIDGDIGQGDLAPPSAIGAAFLSKQITDLRDIKPNLFEFAGSLSPAGIEDIVVMKVKSILDKISNLLKRDSIIIVNTDGYIENGGRAYKIKLAEILHPDIIVYLDDGELSLFNMLNNKSSSWQVIRAQASIEACKSRTERTGQRLAQFLRYVGTGSVEMNLKSINFSHMDKIFSPQGILHFLMKYQMRQANLEGMFVAVGSKNEIIGFAIITQLTHDKLLLQTDVQTFNTVYLSSNVRINKERNNRS